MNGAGRAARCLIVSLALLVLPMMGAGAPAAPDAEAGAGADRLPDLLSRLARTAIRYREFALKFSCAERIQWAPFLKRGSITFNYVFVFEDGFGFVDYRTLPGQAARATPPQETSPERYGIPAYLASPYLWIFSFRAERQPRHEYRILREEVIDGRPATAVHFEPRPPLVAGVNDWYGTAWVDDRTAQLLKVEAYAPAEWDTHRKLTERLAGNDDSGGHYDIERITTFFTVERDGMRFPGKVELRRERLHLVRRKDRWSTWSSSLLQVDQTYSDYRFFGVDAKQRVHEPG